MEVTFKETAIFGWRFYEKIKNSVIYTRKFGIFNIPIKGKEMKFLFIILFGSPQLPQSEDENASKTREVAESNLGEHRN